MCDRINNNITVDFHIHSYASAYKEDKEIVKNSTVDNLNVLFQKLEENNINLFSITDHNIFDRNIFLKCKEKINEKKYINIKNIIPGIEFDIKFEEEKRKYGHIIALFNFKNDVIDSLHLEQIIQNSFLKDKVYSKKEFEELLKEIKLDVILISSQTNALDNTNSSRSLNTHCSNPKDYISCGYISAFEFQKPYIEGILINSLNEIDIHDFAKIISSDCHEWEAYPWHDQKVESFCNKEKKHFTKIKCLPTFKGLMMAFTSPNTRFNRMIERKPIINSIEINNNIIPLVSGINVIIGDNGSGKTAILENLVKEKKNLQPYYKSFSKKYNIIAPITLSQSNFKYVPQSHIFELRKKGSLFDDLFSLSSDSLEVDNTEFYSKINNYFNKLNLFINHQIDIAEKYKKLEDDSLNLIDHDLNKLFYITIFGLESINLPINEHENRNNKLKLILKDLKLEIENNEHYYEKMNLLKNFNNIIKKLEETQKFVQKEYESIENHNNLKNILINKIKDYNLNIKSKSTSLDNEINIYKSKKEHIKNIILEIIKKINEKIIFPNFPSPINGYKTKDESGYKFTRVAQYHNKNVKEDFYENIFTKKLTEEKVKTINSKQQFIDSIKGTGPNNEDYKKIMKENLTKFLSKMSKCEDSILEASSNTNIAGTPGELSLAYYKFIIQDSNWEVLLIDQPEENISNKKIYNNLINYLSNLREQKQIIIVTHNPLLVINLDSDNVIHIKKTSNEIIISNGCLEYENTNYNILSLIADDMDGGFKAIEKRLKVYDKKN